MGPVGPQAGGRWTRPSHVASPFTRGKWNRHRAPKAECYGLPLLVRWSHHQAATAFKQAHVPIREALSAYKGLSQFKYEVFLQGSCKNHTNLGGDSDVDVVVRLAHRPRPRVAALTGEQLQQDASHQGAYQRVAVPSLTLVSEDSSKDAGQLFMAVFAYS